MDVLKLLNELESLIENTRMLGMGVAYNFHQDDFLDLTNKIRASLPDDVKKGDASDSGNRADRGWRTRGGHADN